MQMEKYSDISTHKVFIAAFIYLQPPHIDFFESKVVPKSKSESILFCGVPLWYKCDVN